MVVDNSTEDYNNELNDEHGQPWYEDPAGADA
jgi:hypothetical protein